MIQGNGLMDEDVIHGDTRNFQDLDQLPDNNQNELFAEFERRRRVSCIQIK